jgi:hypothetical protein
MSKCEVLAASVLVLWMPAIGVAQEPTPLRNLPALKSILQDCEQKFADPRFAAIHGKVPFLTPETTTTMRLDVKPNPTELAALRALLPLVIDCDLKAGSDVSGEQRSVTLSSLAQPPAVGALALLASGRITYAEHATLLQGWQRRMTAEYEAKVNEQSTLTLSCVIQNLPPSVAQHKGLETQYIVDLIRQTVRGSRGPEPPKNVRITPTEISFNEAEMYTTISRATGRFTATSYGSGLVIREHASLFTPPSSD